MTDAEQNEFAKLQATVTLLHMWKDAKVPENLAISKFPPVPAKIAGTEIGPAGDSLEIAANGSWRLMGLMTETMVAVPTGWEIYETGEQTALFFPIVKMTASGPTIKPKADELIRATFSVVEAKDFDAFYSGYAAEITAATKSLPGTIEIGPKHPFAGGGYCTIKTSKGFSIVVFTNVKDHPGMGFKCLATTTLEQWKLAGPVFETMMTHWYDKSGTALAPEFKFSDVSAESATKPAG